MNMQMCNNGHFYDADAHAECPSCKKESGEDKEFPKTGVVMDFPTTGSFMAKQEPASEYPKTTAMSKAAPEYPKTAPATGAGEYPKTAPIAGAGEFPKTAPVSNTGNFPKTMPIGSSPRECPKTAPIGSSERVPAFAGWNPVLGWLVCIQGGKRGKDFRLTQEKSYIGRAASNDICLDFDETISRDTTITITYVKEHQVFRLETLQSRNPVSVNEIPVVNELYLRDKDIISIGATELRLVCFCDTSFAWEN